MEYQFESLGPALRIVVLVFLLLAALVGLALVVLIAALPGWIAKRNHHPQALAVGLCGVLGLPTGVLWVVAMVWATWNYNAKVSPSLSKQMTDLEQAIGKLEAKLRGA